MKRLLPRNLYSVLLVVALLAATGCATSECLENGSALPYAGFYSSESVPREISLSGLSVRGVGVPGDSVLLAASSTMVSDIYLPFDLDSDETVYRFDYGEGAGSDEITFLYERQPWFVSSACGVVVNFKIKEIRHTSVRIDSVTCPPGIITNLNMQNLRIYFRTDSSENEAE